MAYCITALAPVMIKIKKLYLTSLIWNRHYCSVELSLWHNNTFNRYLPALPSTTPFMRASARELLVPFFTPLVWCGRDSNPQPPAPKVEALPTELWGQLMMIADNLCKHFWPDRAWSDSKIVCAGSFEKTQSLSGLLYYPTCMWWGDWFQNYLTFCDTTVRFSLESWFWK